MTSSLYYHPIKFLHTEFRRFPRSTEDAAKIKHRARTPQNKMRRRTSKRLFKKKKAFCSVLLNLKTRPRIHKYKINIIQASTFSRLRIEKNCRELPGWFCGKNGQRQIRHVCYHKVYLYQVPCRHMPGTFHHKQILCWSVVGSCQFLHGKWKQVNWF